MSQRDSSTPASLQLHPGQQDLTPAQKAEARRFADERIQAQLSTEPVDERETEALFKQAYEMVRLAAPQHILWLDSPVQLAAFIEAHADAANSEGISLRKRVEVSIWKHLTASLEPGVLSSIEAIIGQQVAFNVWERVGRRIRDRAHHSSEASLWRSKASVMAYHEASWLALYQFYAAHLAPNELQALARFNTLVSGYWLGQKQAAIIRRPRILSRDAQHLLHSATGKCVEYGDGWGFCAWHGVIVPDKVILTPEQLTREDFVNESNLEVRRLIQERMGDRFVPEMGGYVMESGPRGTLYEVHLPDDDWEQVARYVHVQDASSSRTYFLRVPPSIQTAAEAVAWSFNLSVKEYNPLQET